MRDTQRSLRDEMVDRLGSAIDGMQPGGVPRWLASFVTGLAYLGLVFWLFVRTLVEMVVGVPVMWWQQLVAMVDGLVISQWYFRKIADKLSEEKK